MLVFDRRRFRRGFSLVEILVAVLLIGILMAVAAPRLLGARENASDSAAQQQIAQVAAAAEVSYLNSESFANAKEASLQDDVPDIDLTSGTAGIVAGTSARQVGINVTDSDKVWTGVALGGDGRCWYMQIRYVDPVGDRFGFTTGAGRTTCDVTALPTSWNAFEFPAAE